MLSKLEMIKMDLEQHNQNLAIGSESKDETILDKGKSVTLDKITIDISPMIVLK